MIAYVRGELVLKDEDSIIVDNNGIGYNIMVPSSVIDGLGHIGEEVIIYTYTYVKEDAFQLFGFLDRDDLDMFKKLILVNGIGPKGALAILSIMTPDDLRFAILSDDAKKIAQAPGIGIKTASKAILELKDRVDLQEAFEAKLAHNAGIDGDSANDTGTGGKGRVGAGGVVSGRAGAANQEAVSEAVMALVALGYSQSDALKAIKNSDVNEEMSTQQILKEALKHI